MKNEPPADLVLDDRAPVGDALVAIKGLEQRVAPASTVTGAAILKHLREAQFDVEFGRVDLAAVEASYKQWSLSP